MPQKTGIFGPKIPFLALFSLVLALFGPSKGLFGPFLTLFTTKTPIFWKQICGRSSGVWDHHMPSFLAKNIPDDHLQESSSSR